MGCKLAKTIFANLWMEVRLLGIHKHARIKLENELVKESELILVWMIWSINSFWGQQRWCGFPYSIQHLYLAFYSFSHTQIHTRPCIFPSSVCSGSSNKKRMGFECVRLIFYSLHLVGISSGSKYTYTDDTHILMHI